MVPPFGLLVWEDLGSFGPGRWPQSIALDTNEDPFVASVFGDLINSNGTVEKWAAGTWAPVGAFTAHVPNFGHALAISKALVPGAGGDYPSIAYRWASGSQWRIGVSEWNGTTWVDLGGPAVTGPVSDPVLVQDSTSKTIAFTEYSANSTTSRVRVHRWDGTQWSTLGKRLARKGSTRSPSLATDMAGNVFLACESTTRRPSIVVTFSWNGATWQSLGSPTSTQPAARPQIAVGRNGHVAVAFVADPATASQGTRCATWNGTQWQTTAAVTTGVGAFSLGVDSTGDLVVAYEHSAVVPQRIEVAWKVGPTWVIYSPFNPFTPRQASAPIVAIDSHDLPVVAWTEGDLSVFEGPDWSREMCAARLTPGAPGPI